MTVVQNWFMSVQLDLFNRCNLHSCNYYYYKRKPWSHADWTSWPPQCFALSAHNHASFFFFFSFLSLHNLSSFAISFKFFFSPAFHHQREGTTYGRQDTCCFLQCSSSQGTKDLQTASSAVPYVRTPTWYIHSNYIQKLKTLTRACQQETQETVLWSSTSFSMWSQHPPWKGSATMTNMEPKARKLTKLKTKFCLFCAVTFHLS